MFELLLEIFSEEIPARMQHTASEHLKKSVCERLTHNGLTFGDVQAFYTPRRLSVVISDVPAQAQDIREEKRGPRVDAPMPAIEGFLKSTGFALSDLEQRESDKGTFYYAIIAKKGRKSSEIIADFMPEILKTFPWQKSMRWGSGDFTWVRPLHSMICILSDKNQTHIVPFEVAGITASDTTQGHRFMASDVFAVKNFADYCQKLKDAKVILSQEDRKDIIVCGMEEACKNVGLELIPDEGLLQEVVGLVEYPVILMGDIASEFQSLPPEVLKTSMRTHQKFFSVRCPQTQKIVKFITISNCEATDGGKMILNGNQRVLTARLSDAKYFYETDLKKPLTEYVKKLETVTYHAKLGSQAERIERIKNLAKKIAEQFKDISEEDVDTVTSLMKADLMTEMVGEFPELQGKMGYYYALAQGYDSAVAVAMFEHYRPVGASDNVPSTILGSCVALADKFDQLAGFWVIDEKPTGSKDPFALRRAALGIVRIILENKLDFNMSSYGEGVLKYAIRHTLLKLNMDALPQNVEKISDNLIEFFQDRLKVYFRDCQIPQDITASLFKIESNIKQMNILRLFERANILKDFLVTEAGKDVLAGYRRAVNILEIEEKKDKIHYNGDLEGHGYEVYFKEKDEEDLYNALKEIVPHIDSLEKKGDFRTIMQELAKLRTPINCFFENILVNDPDATKRFYRLHLLAYIRNALCKIADFSMIG